MVAAGVTESVPAVAPPVVKFPPVHDVACADVHERSDDEPYGTVIGKAVKSAESDDAPGVPGVVPVPPGVVPVPPGVPPPEPGVVVVVEVTVTCALAVAGPLGPAHDTEYVMPEESAPVEILPDVAFPVEKLVPVQDVAFVEPHVRIDDSPELIVEGFATSVAVTAPAGGVVVTVTVAVAVAEPPTPVHVSVYVVEELGETELVPAVASTVPTLLSMEADVALVQECVSADVAPAEIDAGNAESVAVGVAVVGTVLVRT